jgi:hypothetical protein
MYGSVEGVRALVPANEAIPLAAPITQWLSEGAAIIDRYFVTAGYGVPVSLSVTFYQELVGLNNLFAAAYVKRAVNIEVAGGFGQLPTSELWLRDFYKRLEMLVAADLTGTGIVIVSDTIPGPKGAIFEVYGRRYPYS